jgi:hypothetical protein
MTEGGSAWALRLVDLLGAHPEVATEQHLRSLVTGAVREDADLDFKQESYGNSDSHRRDLAGDLTAMANSRGGIIIIGIRDEADVAVELSPVELDDGAEAWFRQVAAANIAPHLAFDVRVIEAQGADARGYYMLIVPPSGLRPHAVRQDRNLRFARRDGTTTRWLTEAEIADAYRDRFRVAEDQTLRIKAILDEGLESMDTSGAAFLAISMVPTTPGSMTIDAARLRAMEVWARGVGSPNFFSGFFPDGVPITAGVRARRVTLTDSLADGRPPSWQYAQLFDDGAGFACRRLTDPRMGSGDAEQPETFVLNEALLWDIGRCLNLLGRHAVENTGAWSDALVELRLVGTALRLAYLQRLGGGFAISEPIARGQQLDGARSAHTLFVESIARVGQPLAVAVRLLATDIFHDFGSPEVRQIASDGALRTRYLGGDSQLTAWAEANGVELTNNDVSI